MGRWFRDHFEGNGFEVQGYSRSDGPLSARFVQASQIIILSVPVGCMSQVMQTIGPWLKPDQLLMDLGSLKADPLAVMQQEAQCPVIGTHPLFGPSVPSLQDQLVFMCSQYGGDWADWLNGYLAEQGARLVEIDPLKHDRLMAQVQTLRHFLLFALGRTLLDLGFDRQAEGELSGPWFGKLLCMLSHQSQQPADLYTELALHNPFGLETMNSFSKQTQELTAILADGDKPALIEAVSQVERYFGAELAGA